MKVQKFIKIILLIFIFISSVMAEESQKSSVYYLNNEERIRFNSIVDSIKLRRNIPKLFKGAKGIVVIGNIEEKSPFKIGDIILCIGDKPIDSIQDLYRILDKYSANEVIGLNMIRDKERFQIRIRPNMLRMNIAGLDDSFLDYYMNMTDIQKEIEELLKADIHPDIINKLKKGIEIAELIGNNSYTFYFNSKLANIYSSQNETEKTLEYLYKNLKLAQNANNTIELTIIRNNIGTCYRILGRFEEAKLNFAEALNYYRDQGDTDNEITVLANYALIYRDQGKHDKLLQYLHKTLILTEKIEDKNRQAMVLNNIASLYRRTGQYSRAVRYYEKTTKLCRELGNYRGIASNLNGLGIVYLEIGEYEKALENFYEAVNIFKEIGIKDRQATAYNNIGRAYSNLGNYQKSLFYSEKALIINQELNRKGSIANNLYNIGAIYQYLNEIETAMNYYTDSLKIMKRNNIVRGQEYIYTAIGHYYSKNDEYDKTLDYYKKSLEISRKIGNKSTEGVTLNSIGYTYVKLEEFEKALNYYNLALKIRTEIGNKSGEGTSLMNIGYLYSLKKEYDTALKYYKKSLIIFEELKKMQSLLIIYSNISNLYRNMNEDMLAVYFGKKSVNTIQTMRGYMLNIQYELQTSFLIDKLEIYRNLADMLIDQGRLPEAQIVLRMLKEEEYYDFILRDHGQDHRNTQIRFTYLEEIIENGYNEIINKLVNLSREKSSLKIKENIGLSGREKKRLIHLSNSVLIARKNFNQYLNEIRYELRMMIYDIEPESEKSSLSYLLSLQDILKNTGDDTIAVNYLITRDKLRIILTTPYNQIIRDSYIQNSELNRKILSFRQIINNPLSDPFAQAKDLYDIILGPISKDLQKVNAKRILMSLDGTLRYLPFSALYDGEKYVLELYEFVVLTEASIANLDFSVEEIPQNIIAMGLSDTIEGYSSLPGVEMELRGIVRCELIGSEGIIPGKIFLNKDFNEYTLNEIMTIDPPPLLHIASHFVFVPGTEYDSYLLMGDGSRLTLNQLRTSDYDFHSLDLLTLSACDTAITGNKDFTGREIEGFGTLAQDKGARAVLATLWSIEDESTAFFMQNLYKLYKKHGLSKTEALREAQLKLKNKKAFIGDERARRARIIHEIPEYTMNINRPYSHPYYWAPFILMGNWK